MRIGHKPRNDRKSSDFHSFRSEGISKRTIKVRHEKNSKQNKRELETKYMKSEHS